MLICDESSTISPPISTTCRPSRRESMRRSKRPVSLVYSSSDRSTALKAIYIKVKHSLYLSYSLSISYRLFLAMCDTSADIIKPFILGCETKQSKIIQICLTSVQKVIEAKILNVVSRFRNFCFVNHIS